MSQTLGLENFGSANVVQDTRLTDNVASGATTFPIQNSTGFIGGSFIMLGTLGAETTEMLTVQTITATQITTTGPSKFNHDLYDFVTLIFGDTLNVYRAANVSGLQPDDSSFVPVASVPISQDKALTEYTDPNGSADWWYKFTYLNSLSTAETNLAESKSSRGGAAGNYATVEDIRREAGFMYAPYVTDPMIDEKRQAAQDEINGTLALIYNTPFKAPINAFIEDITVRLAAGLLLKSQYGGQISPNNSGNGSDKLQDARDDLQKIVLKEIVLTDENGLSTAMPGSVGGASSWPNDGTAYATPDMGGAPRVFRISDNRGYLGRKW